MISQSIKKKFPYLQILLQSMHKYQPRINILYWDGKLPFQITPREMLRLCVKKSFMFEQTQFIAVTAYQNHEVETFLLCVIFIKRHFWNIGLFLE